MTVPVLTALLLLAGQAGEDRTLQIRELTGQAYVRCLFSQVQRLYPERAMAESVANSAVELCSRSEGEYWTGIYNHIRAHPGKIADPLKEANRFMAERKAVLRTSLIATILDMRATTRGR